MAKYACYPVSYGALTQIWAGTSAKGGQLNGEVSTDTFLIPKDSLLIMEQYLIPWARVGDCTTAAKDPATAKKLWDWLEAQVEGL